MVARNFSEDGASGAGGLGGGNFGQAINVQSQNNTGMPMFGTTPADSGAGAMTGQTSPTESDAGSSLPTPGFGGGWGGGGLAPPSAASDSSTTSLRSPAGLSFSAGGAIDTGDGDDPNATDPQGSAGGNAMQAQINAALGSVKDVLSYGRNLHGLGGGGQDEGAGIQVAGRMPSVPGNPSDSGVQRPQPMPGPLPPTSNPFGKRADAGDTSQSQGASTDDDDSSQPQAGAIDTEEAA